MNTQESEQEFDPFATEKKKKDKSGSGLAMLALLLALVSISLGAWQWWQGQSDAGGEDEALSALQQVQSGQQDQAQRLQSLNRRLDAQEEAAEEFPDLKLEVARLQGEVAETRSRAGDGQSRYEDLNAAALNMDQRIAALESGLAALAVRGESPEKRIELAQVDFLLRTANERLQLFRDGRSAGQALSLADAQLEALDDPLYLPVRRSIASARLTLDNMPEVDVLDLTARIASLQAGINGLPFSGEAAAPVQAEPAEEGVDVGEPPGIWARFKSAMAGLVTVRRRVPDDSLINLEDKDYIRQGLWLQLESARLALMREDAAAWAQSLGRARAALEQYFDASDNAVQRADDELQALAGVELDVPLPDISEPWATLNLLRTGSMTPQEAATPDMTPVIEPEAAATGPTGAAEMPIDTAQPEPGEPLTAEAGEDE